MGTKLQHTIDAMVAYETGDLPDEEIIALFRELVETGLAWQLQGHYGRTAQALIDAGWIDPPEEK